MKVKIQSKTGQRVVNLNRRKAIRERCLNCSGYSQKGVTECSFTECPLYEFRSGQGKQNPKKRDKAIRKYCLWCTNDQISLVSKCSIKDCPLFAYRKTGIDRSVEIGLTQKIPYIEPLLGDKKEDEYKDIP